jgi:hypothetical protein
MRFIRHPEVPQELEAAALWYEEHQPGLGSDFLEEYQATMAQVLVAPERWRKILGDNRKLNFHRFPYAIIYSTSADTIYVKAVMHLHRRPFYWRHR